MSDELLPCPFCGSEVDMDDFGGKNRDGTQGGIMIDCCNPECFLAQFSRGGPRPYGKTDEILAAWNTRHTEEPRDE